MHESTEINLSQYVFLENVDDKDFGKNGLVKLVALGGRKRKR